MIIPIRCFSCGNPIGHLWEEFKKRKTEGENEKQILDDLGLERFCCRRMFVSHIEYIDDIIKYKNK